MELFKAIADNTEKQLVLVIKKKTVDSEVFLTVVAQQDELTPVSFRGKPELLDEAFAEDYKVFCNRMKNLKPEPKADNVEEVVKEEKAEIEEKETKEKAREDLKKKATTPAKADPLKAVQDKIAKLKKADKEKVDRIIKSIGTSKDADVVKYSVSELERAMNVLKFTKQEIELITKAAKSSNGSNLKKDEKAATGDTGMFATEGKEPEAELVDVKEEEDLTDEEAPWEGDEENEKGDVLPKVPDNLEEEPEPEPEPAKPVPTKKATPAKKPAVPTKKATPLKKEEPKKEEPNRTGPLADTVTALPATESVEIEENDLLF